MSERTELLRTALELEVARIAEIKRLRARVAVLETALRDECMGHKDGCKCARCALVFAIPGEGP